MSVTPVENEGQEGKEERSALERQMGRHLCLAGVLAGHYRHARFLIPRENALQLFLDLLAGTDYSKFISTLREDARDEERKLKCPLGPFFP